MERPAACMMMTRIEWQDNVYKTLPQHLLTSDSCRPHLPSQTESASAFIGDARSFITRTVYSYISLQSL